MFNSAPGRAEYVASTAQSKYTFVFKIFNESNIIAYRTSGTAVANPHTDILKLGVDYAVTINGDNGGDVVLLNVGPGDANEITGGERITLVRFLPVTRHYEYHQDGQISPDTLNSDFDYQVYLVAQELEASSRAILMPPNMQGIVSNVFPAPSELHYIRWSKKDPVTGEIHLENDVNIPFVIQKILDAELAMKNSVLANGQHLNNIDVKLAQFAQDLATAGGASGAAIAAAAEVARVAATIKQDLLDATATKDSILLNQHKAITAAGTAESSATSAHNSEVATIAASNSVNTAISGVSSDLAAAQTMLSTVNQKLTDTDAKLATAQNIVTQVSADKTIITAAKNAAQLAATDAASAKVAAQSSQTAAETSKTSATASALTSATRATEATTKAVDSANSALEAKHWAIFPHNQDVPEGNVGEKSAFHWAIEARAAAIPATNTAIEAGTDNVAEITSLGLAHGVPFIMNNLATVTSSADKFIKTNAAGKIDPTLIPSARDNFKGTFKPTVTVEYPTGTLVNGDFFVIEGLGLGVNYTFSAGDLNSLIVSDRDELITDGTTWHIIGKANTDVSDLIPKSAFADQSQTDAGTASDLVVSPKTMKDASVNIMTAFMNSQASTTGQAGKLVMIPSTGPDAGVLPPLLMPLGIGKTETLAKTALKVSDMRGWNKLSTYCLPDIVVTTNTFSDTMLLFGIANAYKEVMVVPMRDKNVFMAFGLDSSDNPIQWTMVMPKLTVDTLLLSDPTAPKFHSVALTKVV